MESYGDGSGDSPWAEHHSVTADRENVLDGNDGNGLSAQLPSDLALRLRELGRHVSPDQISDVWIFPPLPDMEGSAEFLLFTRFLPEEMRRLCAAELASPRNGNGRASLPADASGKGGRSSKDASPGAGGNGNGSDAGTPAGTNGGNGKRALGGRITEYGAVPSHRVPRLLAGFRKRLGDMREPLHFEVGGCPLSWDRLVTPPEKADARV